MLSDFNKNYQKKIDKDLSDLKDSSNLKFENDELLYFKKKKEDLKKKFILKKIEYKNKEEKLNERLQREICNVYSFSLEKKFLDLLNIFDSIEMALVLFKNSKNDVDVLKKKLNEIFIKMSDIFKDYSINSINSIDVVFNPLIHQAISLDFSGKYSPNRVSNIIQKGYLLHKKLLRPAIVSVSKDKV